MKFEARQIAVPILLAFVLGITSVNAHASTHLLDEAVDCELCSAYSNPPAGNDGSSFELSSFVQASAACEHPREWTENQIVRRLFARGPPTIKR
jgi:hypothetical protein